MSSSLFDSLAHGLSALLGPIGRVAGNPAALNRLLAAIGVMPDADSRALANALGAVAELKNRIEALGAQSLPSFASIAAVLDASADAFEALRRLERAGGPLSALEGLGQDLVTLLVIASLESRLPALRHVAALLTLLEPAEEQQGHPPVIRDGRLLREPYRLERFHLDRLPKLLRDPVATLRAEYGNPLATTQDAHVMADKLFPRLLRLLRALGVSCRYGYDPADEAFLGDAAPLMAHTLIIYTDDPLNAAAAEAGLVLSLSSADQGDLGLVISPFGTLSSQRPAGPWMIAFELTAGVDVVAWGRHGVTLLASPGAVEVTGRASATLASPADQPAYVLGQPDGTRIDLAGAMLAIETALSAARQSLGLLAEVSAAALVIAPGDGDGFLASILPAKGMRTDFDLGLAWSSERGLTLRGSTSLDATLPIGLSIGGVTLSTVHLSLQARDASVLAEVSASIAVSIGPVHTVIDRVGIATAVTFPEGGGNVGVADLDLHFKPPNGLGLAIDSPIVLGGGFLRFDPQKQEYGGILQLEIAETIAVKAIGLLTTRMPDGSKGFSLVVIMSAEGFPPIQLGFGFTLTGIGGLLGVNRTVMVDVLRSGLKNGTLGSILFPEDPIRNAPQIVSDLRAVFPPVKDRHVFGPMAIIAWGTPTILTLEIGLLLELPEPVRLIILGRLRAVLPDEDHALVQVRMDAIGVIDFNKEEVSLDATLYDSRILAFVLTGDMALRANWGAQPNFVLAIGGFNPRFPAPAGFPRLARLALSLADSDNPRLRFESYLALTSNTVQFGARLDFSYSAAGLTLAGFLGFDALFQFAPFKIIADVGAMVALKRGSKVLMGVFLDMTLAGPTPWHVWGKATFKVLFFKVSIRFDHRFGHEEPPALPEPIDVLTLLADALGDRRNWSSALPRGEHSIVSLRDSAATQATLRVHPLAELTVRQRVVPFNRPVTKFGNVPLGEQTTFTVAASGIDNTPLRMPSTMVRDSFALAQYQEMSDEEKLTRPAFEAEDAGLQFGVDEVAYQYEALPDTTIAYETLMIDPTRPAETVTVTAPYVLPQTVLDAVVSLGAAGQAAIRRSGSSRYRALERAA